MAFCYINELLNKSEYKLNVVGYPCWRCMYQCKDSLKRWFYGHWHLDEEFYDGKFKALLNDVDVLD